MSEPESTVGAVDPGVADPARIPADELLSRARDLLPWMVEIRRELHQYPELGLEEHRTGAKVQATLDELGIDYVNGAAETGVVGTLEGAVDGPVFALRADLDALPLQEANDVDYRSRVDGKMHACGHDVHTAILLGAARLLRDLDGVWRGTAKLLFQPAEETDGGARMMIEQGVLDDPRVEAIFGLHVEPELDVGTIGLHYGQRNASSDYLQIVVHGRSGHGAYPAGTVDSIAAAAQVITALQTIVSRNLDARQSAVLSIGAIQGGVTHNVVADRVQLIGTIRTLDPDIRTLMAERVRETAEGVAAAFGARAEVSIEPGYEALINDDSMVDIVRQSARDLVGEENVTILPKANMGVEDFGEFTQRVPGAFFSLGVRNEAAGIVNPLHHVGFDVDESCMAYGAAVQVLNLLNAMQR
jgi:amidohydrolase